MDPTNFVYLSAPTADHGHFTGLLLAYLRAFSKHDHDHFVTGSWIETLSSVDLSRFELLAECWTGGDMTAATDDFTGVLSLAIDAESSNSVRKQLARLRGKRSLRMQFRTLRLRGERLQTIARVESLRRQGLAPREGEPLRVLRSRDYADALTANARRIQNTNEESSHAPLHR